MPALLLLKTAAAAHPMGNFSINHYAAFKCGSHRLDLRYVIDMAEIPTAAELRVLDANGDGRVTEDERTRYAAGMALALRQGVTLSIDGRAVGGPFTAALAELRPGAGGLHTLRISLALQTPLHGAQAGRWNVDFRDTNFAERTGWKAIIATAGPGMSLANSTAASSDASRELTAYPTDPTVAPPQQTEAHFTLIPSGAPAGKQLPVGLTANHAANGDPGGKRGGPGLAAPTGVSGIPAPAGAGGLIDRSRSTTTSAGAPVPRGVRVSPSGGSSSASTGPLTTSLGPRTPQDGFTQSIARPKLTSSVIVVSLILAFLFGALHALSPGHGKAMVAAYLVGSRGTVKHAAFLGGVITLTHTITVYALGLVTLAAAQYVVPERLYPILSLVSGISIIVLGLALLSARLKDWRESAEDEEAEETGLPPNATVSLRSLITLGVTGGAVPCPSALVVMLGAIALHRIGFGLALICAFSLGLAAVLTGLGILVVRLRALLDRLPLRAGHLARLPIVSAALVTLVGVVLVVSAIAGKV